MKILRNKNGQGMPFEIMVIIAILLVILVIAMYMLTGSSKSFSDSIKDCESKGGVEQTKDKCKELGGFPLFTISGSGNTEKVCCLIT